MAIIHSSMCILPFSLVLPLAVTRCHLFSFVVTRCHSLSLADIRCTTHCDFCHSLLFVVTRCTTCCHSFLLLVIRCITGLTFYRRFIQSKFATTYSLKIDAPKLQKCKKCKKFIVLAKPLKQFVIAGTVWQKCRPITFKFTKQLLTEVSHRDFSRILF